MNPDSGPDESSDGEYSGGRLTIFHVLAVCCALTGAALGGIVGLRYGIIGYILGVAVGVPFGYYVGYYGVIILLVCILSLIYPRDESFGILAIVKSGLSKIQRRTKN